MTTDHHATLRAMLDGSVCAYCGKPVADPASFGTEHCWADGDPTFCMPGGHLHDDTGIPLALRALLTAMVAEDAAGGEAGR